MIEGNEVYRLLDLLNESNKLIRDINLNLEEINELMDLLYPDGGSVTLLKHEDKLKLFLMEYDTYLPVNVLIDPLTRKINENMD